MSISNNTNTTQSSHVNVDISFSYPVRFWIYLLGDIPSIICSIFVLYHLLFDRTLRHALNNHVIIILLIIELTDVPWTLHYYLYNTNMIETPAFCIIWGWINFGLYVTQLLVFAWASLERHILIFHDQWVSTKRKRFFVHYLPPILILAYCFIYFAVVFLFPPCQNWFDCLHMHIFQSLIFFVG
jgi:hypothetical protein